MASAPARARRTALLLLYQWDLTGQPLAALYEGEIDQFSRELAEGVAAEAEELDRTIDAPRTLDVRSPRRARAERAPDRRLRARSRYGPGRGGDLGGGQPGQALRIRRGSEARQRRARRRGARARSAVTDPLAQADALLAAARGGARAARAGGRARTSALELLEEIAQLAREAHTEIERAKDRSTRELGRRAASACRGAPRGLGPFRRSREL